MNPTVEDIVTEAVVCWARSLVLGKAVPRRNLRLVLGDPGLVDRARTALSRESNTNVWFAVASSADPKAVLWRNEAPPSPPGVSPEAPIVYLVFWSETEPGHDRNAQSLRDISAVDVADVLSTTVAEELSLERRMRERCRAAAEGWTGKAGATCAAQLEKAWEITRDVIRSGRGGRDETLPFVERLEVYARWLSSAFIPDPQWASIGQADRAAALVRQWGEALPELGLFRLPALASVIGIPAGPNPEPAKKAVVTSWGRRLREILAENQAAAVDFAALQDQIEGKSSLEMRLKQLEKIPLSQVDPYAARDALTRFCRDGNAAALGVVEWLFHEKAEDRRSASHGLKGLLIARSTSAPQRPPLDRAYDALRDRLVELCADDASAQEGLSSFSDWLRGRVKSDRRFASTAADAIRQIGERQTPSIAGLDPAQRAALAKVAGSQGMDPEQFARIARAWEGLAAVEEDTVEASSALLGLARLLFRRLKQRPAENGKRSLGSGTLVLEASDVSALELSSDDWSAAQRGRLTAWLRDQVLPSAGQDPESEEGAISEATVSSEVVITVSMRRDGAPLERLGEVVLPWTELQRGTIEASSVAAAWSMAETDSLGFQPVQLLQVLKTPNQTGVGGLFDEVSGAFKAYLVEITGKAQSALAHALGPLPNEARAWVEAWSRALDWVDAEGAADGGNAEKLDVELESALARGDIQAAQALHAQIGQAKRSPVSSLPGYREVRPLLQACTAEITGLEGGRRPIMSFFSRTTHSVLRLRLVAEDLLCDCLRAMAMGWPEDGLSDLEDTLDEWGAPEPIHFYGGWWGGDPLVFDRWVADFGVALFGVAGDRDGSDTARQGIREASRVLDRYSRLYPAAADRLSLRVLADEDGRWACRLVDVVSRGDDLGTLRADIDVDLPGDGATLSRESWSEPERRRLLEMQDDGTEPQIRLRASKDPSAPAHVAFVVGEAVDELRPTIGRFQGEPIPGNGDWSTALLFEGDQPQVLEAAHFVGAPQNELCRKVALAVGYGRDQELSMHGERYSFDETIVRAPIQRLHRGVHWLALGSRRPMYRAVQAAGVEVATLLDFRTTRDAGRPLHVCVSIAAGELSRDLRRFSATLRGLIGEDVEGLPEAVVTASRHFAPGLAINCAGAPTSVAIEGLIGLLLTAQAVRASQGAEALVLALDQHQGLLARGHDDSRSDILYLRQEKDGAIVVSVVESKLSLNAASAETQVVGQALSQVKRTFERLDRFAASHPLVPAARAALRAALAQHLDLAGATKKHVDGLRPLMEAISQPTTVIRLARDEGEVHVWSLAPETKADVSIKEGTRVIIHDRAETMSGLKSMLNVCQGGLA